MNRTTLKTFGCKSADISSLHLYFILQGDLKAKDPDLLKLGLLYEVGVDAATVDEPETLLCFQQKSLQEFSCSKHLAKRLDNINEKGDDMKVSLPKPFLKIF